MRWFWCGVLVLFSTSAPRLKGAENDRWRAVYSCVQVNESDTAKDTIKGGKIQANGGRLSVGKWGENWEKRSIKIF
ncbi:MAG: hypothetical protein IKW83_08215 [Muribaculaceae bacterium]|nr:hypothetical protein [Bacteroidaceae bacterium]MBR5639733.1 hypothetical protein [Muribaculaceae bacterium]